MPIVEIGNVYYFLYIAIALGITYLSVLFLKSRSDRFRFWFIFGIIITNLAVHFLKLLIFPYNDPYYAPHIWVKASFENICAANVLLLPFMYFSKNKVIKDFLVLLGITSGILAIAFPVEVFSTSFDTVPILYTKGAFDIETIRFYTTHFLIFLAPFLMMHFKQHQLSIKRIIYAPMMLIGLLFIVYFNELILSLIGWVPSGSAMMDPLGRNPSLIFGIKDVQSLTGIGNLIKILVPKFLTVNPITGETFFWPVVWLIGPIFVYGLMAAFIYALIYDKQNTVAFVVGLIRDEKEQVSDITSTNNE